jgi:hypothetical protein
MTGFGNRPGPSEGVHDDLRAGAVYLSDGTTAAIIITADLIGLDQSEIARIRDMIEERTGMPGGHVMISCSHTHSGPATRCLRYLGEVDDAYLSVLERQMAGAAKMAVDSARPALFGCAREPVSVGINRREVSAGRTIIGRDEAGLTAPYVDVWSLDDAATGAPLARLFCHAAHAVTMGGDNLLLSADWPGYAQRYVERIFPGAAALFAQGCCGNINSDPRGAWEIAERQGQVMAGAVAKADGRPEKRSEARVRVASETVQLPLMDPPPLDEAQALLEAFTRERDAGVAAGENRGMMMMRDGIVAWADGIVALSASGQTGRTLPYEVQAISVGDAVWVGLPGEVFVEYALNIDKSSPFGLTTVAAYTNANPGYVPTAAAHQQGGYEVVDAIHFYGDMMMGPDSEAVILGGVRRVLAALR